MLGRWVPSQLLFDPTRRCNPFWLKAVQIPMGSGSMGENRILRRPKNWKDIRSPKKQPPPKKQSCIHISGSTIGTLLHGKINLKKWRVASPLVIQGFSNFQGCFRWLWQTRYISDFFLLIGIINDCLAHIPCLRKQPKLPYPSIRKKFPNRNCWVRNLWNVSSKRPTVGKSILEIKNCNFQGTDEFISSLLPLSTEFILEFNFPQGL